MVSLTAVRSVADRLVDRFLSLFLALPLNPDIAYLDMISLFLLI
jgi:hypothetical protein